MASNEIMWNVRRHYNVPNMTSDGRKLTRTVQMSMVTNELSRLRMYNGDSIDLSKDWIQATDHVPDLHNAAFKGDLHLVKRIIKHSRNASFDPDSGINDGPKLLKVSTKPRNLEDYTRETYVGFFVGTTPLMMAAQQGHLSFVKYLIECAHVDVNGCDSLGLTPLSLACAFNHEAVAKYLLSHHAQRNCQDTKYGMTPLILASINNHNTICEFLLNHHVEIDITDKYGRKAIHYAAWNYNWDLVDILRHRSDDSLNVRDHNQDTPLHLLVSDYSIEPEEDGVHITKPEMTLFSGITRRLACYKNCTVDIKRETYRGKGILGEELDCFVNMISNGANLLATNNIGHTPLLSLCARMTPVVYSHGYLFIEQPTLTQILLVMLKILIKDGRALDSVDSYGMTALSLCNRQKNWLAVKMLSSDGTVVRSDVTVDRFNSLAETIAAFGWTNLFHHKQIERDVDFMVSALEDNGKADNVIRMTKRIFNTRLQSLFR
ncbi:hypothetical protein ACF0H5_003034 [Mactra antiquata]